MSKTVLFEKKADCCGCGACQNICPKGAIEMKYDAFGIAYPVIDPALCVECGLCKKVCSYQNQRQRCDAPQLAYAAAAADGGMAKNSASGGVFAALARHILKAGGVVYGCAFSDDDGILIPKHIRVDNESDLHRLQGSKYVQSITGMVYRQVKQDLKEGKNVLFSGTPCQVDALNGFLSPTKSENLLTVDIICHGTPGTRFFVDYIKEVEEKHNGRVLDFRFRDKTGGWGLKAAVLIQKANRGVQKKLLPVQLSSYYQLFLDSETYRGNCYSCPYANQYRVGDITLGDFWGVEKEHPDFLKENGGCLDKQLGISCLLVNTEKGRQWVEQMNGQLVMAPSTLASVVRENRQLNVPSSHNALRDAVMELYKKGGYPAVDRWYYKRIGIKKYVYCVWNCIPKKYQVVLKKMIKQR